MPTSTKPVGGNIKAKQRSKASTGVSLENHGILEGDRTASLYSHGQALEQICYFPGVICDAGDAPANLLCELDSHVVPCASRLDSERVGDMGANHPGVLICLSLSRLMGCRTCLGSGLVDVGLGERSGNCDVPSHGFTSRRRVVPLGRLPSSRIRLTGSLTAGIWARFSALRMMSFK